MKTRTGGFPIGFRRLGAGWQDDLDGLIAWMKGNALEVIDLRATSEDVAPVLEAGLHIGSVDLLDNKGLIASDREACAESIARNTAFIRACTTQGPINFFAVLLPTDPTLSRGENFGYMVASLTELAPVLEESGSHLVIEGYPGPGALCCTPEEFRELFEQVPSPAIGINYDPSHLLRQGIDPLRFLDEFGERVHHIHGKDTEIIAEGVYEYGWERPAAFAPRIGFGANAWRYTLPGQGVMRWGAAFAKLETLGYRGCVSIELEDSNFNGTEEAEKAGIVLGAQFLSGC